MHIIQVHHMGEVTHFQIYNSLTERSSYEQSRNNQHILDLIILTEYSLSLDNS